MDQACPYCNGTVHHYYSCRVLLGQAAGSVVPAVVRREDVEAAIRVYLRGLHSSTWGGKREIVRSEAVDALASELAAGVVLAALAGVGLRYA